MTWHLYLAALAGRDIYYDQRHVLGLDMRTVLEAIVTRLPPPKSEGGADAPLKALLVDAWYDAYLGVVVLVRVIDGRLKKGQKKRKKGTVVKKSPAMRLGLAKGRVMEEDILYFVEKR